MVLYNKRHAASKVDLVLQRVARGVGLHRAYYDTREIARARVERLDIEKNWKLGLLFIHVPKCGGTSIEAQMGFTHDHRSAVYFRTADPAFFAKAWKFSIARNPYDRLVSAFHHFKRLDRPRQDPLSKGQKRSRTQIWSVEVLGSCPDFATFVDRLADTAFRERMLAWVHFQPQWYFLCDRSGRVLVDEVAHLESLDAFTERFNAAGHGLTLDARRAEAPVGACGLDELLQRRERRPRRRDVRPRFRDLRLFDRVRHVAGSEQTEGRARSRVRRRRITGRRRNGLNLWPGSPKSRSLSREAGPPLTAG